MFSYDEYSINNEYLFMDDQIVAIQDEIRPTSKRETKVIPLQLY